MEGPLKGIRDALQNARQKEEKEINHVAENLFFLLAHMSKIVRPSPSFFHNPIGVALSFQGR